MISKWVRFVKRKCCSIRATVLIIRLIILKVKIAPSKTRNPCCRVHIMRRHSDILVICKINGAKWVIYILICVPTTGVCIYKAFVFNTYNYQGIFVLPNLNLHNCLEKPYFTFLDVVSISTANFLKLKQTCILQKNRQGISSIILISAIDLVFNTVY